MISKEKKTEAPSPEAKPEKPKFNWKRVLIASGVAGVIIIAIGGAYYYYQTKVADMNTESAISEPSAEQEVQELVTWQEPQKVKSLGLYVRTGTAESMGGVSTVAEKEKESAYYEVGTVNVGKYQGGKVIVMVGYRWGVLEDDPIYRFVDHDSKLYLLGKYSDKVGDNEGIDSKKFTIDNSFDIPDLNFPKTIQDKANEESFARDLSAQAMWTAENLKESFKDEVQGTVYTTKEQRTSSEDYTVTLYDYNGFYIKSPDGTVVVYSLTVNFMDKTIPQVTFNDGAGVGDYSYTDRTGCGSSNYLSVPSGVSKNDLKEVGENKWGDPIYGFKNSNHAMLKEYYKRYSDTYISEAGAAKSTYAEFVAEHPIFFWETPYGQLVKFENTAYGLNAECGKPVIYLYPEQAMPVSVKVDPVGGMTYSDPEYGTGWNVIADTASNIKDLISGKTYPYLFWEGRGGIYTQPDRGFVVAKKDVHSFLTEKLSKYGLNSKEIADFQEFWEPRMKQSPYYFVSFLGNSEMDALAPLTVSPKPGTVIRVLMDFSPLEKPIKVQGYDIQTPKRNGFTVVEWGGVLREWRR